MNNQFCVDNIDSQYVMNWGDISTGTVNDCAESIYMLANESGSRWVDSDNKFVKKSVVISLLENAIENARE
jgi:hypothetical protein